MTRTTRQLFLQLCAWRRYHVEKGDVSSAFLQGDELEDDVFTIPVPELCEELRLPKDTVCKLTKAAYGLVIAPLSWYKSVHNYLKELGFVRCRSDPCLWILFGSATTTCGGKEIIGIICGHIDDFLFGGDINDKRWTTIKENIKQRFWWGDWEANDFV